MVFKHLLIAAAAAFLISALSIQQTKAIEIPGTLGQCLQKIEPRVCDPQNVLSEDERTKLDALLVRVEEGTKRDGYPLKIRSKDCGSNGITMPVVQLKIASDDMDTLQTQLTDLLQEYTDAHPCKRIAFVVLNADDDKVENRRFWTGTNWNVNVKPIEVVAHLLSSDSFCAKSGIRTSIEQYCREVPEHGRKSSERSVHRGPNCHRQQQHRADGRRRHPTE